MITHVPFLLLALAATAPAAPASSLSHSISTPSYTLVADYSGPTFFDGFTTFTGPDPTHGNVNYLDMPTAAERELLGFIYHAASNATHAYIGVDYTTRGAANRDSVRLVSKRTFDVGTLAVFDIRHIPAAVGTWPSWWFLGDVSPQGIWPGNGGEVDVLEFVHGTEFNSMTLHTAPGCVVDNSSSSSSSGVFQGSLANADCNAGAGSLGCSVATPAHTHTGGLATAGPAFNAQGGAVYAMLWTAVGVSVYIFAHDRLPADLVAGRTPDPSTWTAQPLARFAGAGCDFTKSLSTMQLIEDITFCGDWAGKVWGSMGLDRKTGSASCEEYVRDRPESFRDAYFEVAGIRIYEEKKRMEKRGLFAVAAAVEKAIEAASVEFPSIDLRERYAGAEEGQK